MRDLLLAAKLPASLNSHVGHLAIIDDQSLADHLESILKAKQSCVGCFLVAKVQTFSLLFRLPLARTYCFWISQMFEA